MTHYTSTWRNVTPLTVIQGKYGVHFRLTILSDNFVFCLYVFFFDDQCSCTLNSSPAISVFGVFFIQGQLYCEANFDHNMTKVLYYSNCDGNDIRSLHVGYVNIVLN